jgi:hypothetical protein
VNQVSTSGTKPPNIALGDSMIALAMRASIMACAQGDGEPRENTDPERRQQSIEGGAWLFAAHLRCTTEKSPVALASIHRSSSCRAAPGS